MSMVRGVRSAVPMLQKTLQRRTAMTACVEEYKNLKDKIEREPKLAGKMYKHSAYLNVRDKQLTAVWFENAIFYYSLALTPFLALFYLQ